MREKAIDYMCDTIIDNVHDLADEIVARNESLTKIYNICNDADEYNWRDCITKIQDEVNNFV